MAILKFGWHFPDWYNQVNKAHKRIGLFIAAQMQSNRAELFQRSGDFQGHQKWAPLKLRNGKPLMDKGTLKNSIGPMSTGAEPIMGPNGIVRVVGDKVTIGTSVAYAHTQSYGAIIRPKRAKALKIPMGKGKGYIFRKKVVIPSREFHMITQQDSIEFATALRNLLAGMLNGTNR